MRLLFTWAVFASWYLFTSVHEFITSTLVTTGAFIDPSEVATNLTRLIIMLILIIIWLAIHSDNDDDY